MSDRLKRILLVIGFLAIAVLFGYLIFRLFFAPLDVNENVNYNINGYLPNVNITNRPVINGNENVNGAVLYNVNAVSGYTPPSEIASGGATIVSPIVETLTQDLVIASNKKDVVYYDPLTGEFYRVNQDGTTKTKLTEDTYPSAEKVYWSPSQDKAILSFPDDSKITYDFNLKKQYSLPKETDEFSFSPSGSQIAFKYVGADPGDNWLAVSSPDSSGAKIIEDLGEYADQVTVSWSPNNQIIANYAKGSGINTQEIIFLGQNNENFPAVDVPGRGFKSIWSPAGDQILFSVFNEESNYNPSLYIMNGSISNLGAYQTSLNIATWPDKCVFGTDNAVYCAVPRFLPSGSDLYPELAQNLADDFYKIDLVTGAKTLLAQPVNTSGYGNFTAESVFLSAGGEFLYFTDESTGRVYKIRLK